MTLFFAGFLALLLCAGTGCGLLLNGTKQEVCFYVEPKDAKIFVDGKPVVGTRVELERKKGHRYRIEHPDYDLDEGLISTKISIGPALLDLLFWPAYLVDIPSGSLNQFEKDRIVVKLDPIGSKPKPASVAKKERDKSTRKEPKFTTRGNFELTASIPGKETVFAVLTENQLDISSWTKVYTKELGEEYPEYHSYTFGRDGTIRDALDMLMKQLKSHSTGYWSADWKEFSIVR